MKKQLQLLRVEDDDADRRALRHMVQAKHLPWEITDAGTLAAARARLNSHPFDLVIADSHLPDGEGTDLYGDLPNTPFILLTGTLEEQATLRTLSRVTDDLLVKDRRRHYLDALPIAVEKTLRRQRLRRIEQRLARKLRLSEERWRLLVSEVKDYAIVMLDPSGRVVTWNDGAERLAGYTAEEIVGRHFSEFYPPEMAVVGKPARVLKQALERGRFVEEGWRVRKNGARFWARVTITPVLDPRHRLKGFAKVTQDLSTAKQLEDLLQSKIEDLETVRVDLNVQNERLAASQELVEQERRRYHDLFEHAPDAYIVTDLCGQITEANQAAYGMLGPFLRNFPLSMFVAPQDKSRVRELLQNFRSDRTSSGQAIEVLLQTTHGTPPVPCALSVNAVMNESGEVIAARWLARDISERKQAERRVTESEQRLRMAMEIAGLGYGESDVIAQKASFDAQAQKILGLSEPVMSEAAAWNLVHPADRGAVEAADATLRDSQRAGAVVLEHRIVRPDGQMRWVMWHGKALYNESVTPARLMRFVYVLRDITDRKQAEETLRLQAAALDAAANGIIITDRKGVVQWVNHAFTRLTGFDANEVIGRTPRILRSGQHEPEFYRELWNTILSGQVWQGQVVNRRKDGTLYTEELTITPVTGGDEVTHFVGINHDVTRRIRTEQALRDSEQLFHSLADNIAQLAWMTDASGGILWMSQRWLDYTGRSLEAMRQGGWAQVHHPEHVERVKRSWDEHMRLGERWEETFPLLGKDGTYRWFLSCAIPIRNAQGELIRWFGTNTDVTAEKEAEAELEAARRQLQEYADRLEALVEQRTSALQSSLGSIEELLYTIAHDLRAPNRAMQGMATVLLEEHAGNLDPTGLEYLQHIREAALQNDRLMCDLLAYGQLSHVDLPLEPVPLGEVAAAVHNELATEIQARGAVLHSPTKWPVVIGARSSLEQVLANLIGNALKFVAPGVQPVVHLSVDEDRSTGRVRLHVRDNGIGIPLEHQARVWQPFQRLHGPRQYEGTGMGLAIVRKTVERMKGRVFLESAPGRGSDFIVELLTPPQTPPQRPS